MRRTCAQTRGRRGSRAKQGQYTTSAQWWCATGGAGREESRRRQQLLRYFNWLLDFVKVIDDELEADILQAVCVVAVRCDENGDDVVASDALADGVPAAQKTGVR